MIELLPESHESLVGFRFIGEITHDDYAEDFMPQLRRVIKEHGMIRLFVDISDLQNEGIGVMDEDVSEDSRLFSIEPQLIAGDEG